ncbi:MAG: hypothetical protein V2I33_16005 [Kangiellaceae bacterium]|nr:hypothetical protein [Kangiellaceae bacterium]
MKIPSNVLYGHWNIPFTLVSFVTVIGVFIEFFQSQYWFLLFSILSLSMFLSLIKQNLSIAIWLIGNVLLILALISMNKLIDNYTFVLFASCLSFFSQILALVIQYYIDN